MTMMIMFADDDNDGDDDDADDNDDDDNDDEDNDDGYTIKETEQIDEYRSFVQTSPHSNKRSSERKRTKTQTPSH